LGDEKSGCSNLDADVGWLRIIGWPGLNSASRGWLGETKKLAKLVADSGNLLLDGEFNPPPPPPDINNGLRYGREPVLFPSN